MLKPSSPLSAISLHYAEELEARYQADPSSIDPGWRCVLDVLHELDAIGAAGPSIGLEAVVAAAYRQHGHLVADLDPLSLVKPALASATDAALQTLAQGVPSARVEQLRRIYGGTLAVESGHLDDPALREWVRAQLEDNAHGRPLAGDRQILEQLIAADEFERFMAVRFTGKKRFGAEGAEALIPMVDRLLRNAARVGITEVLIGTMHRGRLNLMASLLGKPLALLFAEFKGLHPFGASSAAAADVPYHLGHETTLKLDGRALRVTLLPNPSHLEAVNPVLLGRVRARQTGREVPKRVLGVILHTDASVIAQGLVAETLQLSRLPGFSTCGTVHLIINNQIGFTTERDEARSSAHCTGLWKSIDSLIVHANGDDPRAALRAVDLAFDFRETHGRDAVIDLVCYRRNGHNEVDEPRFTQPQIYRRIDRHPSVTAAFAAQLVAAGTVNAAEIEALALQQRSRLGQAYDAAAGVQATLPPERVTEGNVGTGVAPQRLRTLLAALATAGDGVNVNPKVQRIVSQRAQANEAGVPWPVAEALAFASLLVDGTPVRFCGQDSLRGAFSQRHLALVDTQTGRPHLTLASLTGTQARFEALNSPLSEYAVLGFEYGYSVERPESLVIWEAQFGDFANGAQILIDQFLASGEEKWQQSSGLVVLLPHGLEGQGPEHSSGRLERFLQLCAQDNLDVLQPTTAANYFHALRRQVLRRRRKPLIVLSAKSMLRLPAAFSPLEAFGPGGALQPVIAQAYGAPVRHVLLCTGKIAYDLERAREARNLDQVAIVRLEQLYPFPDGSLAALFRDWGSATFTWVQEEPRNLGAWNFVDRRLEALLKQAGVRQTELACVSRPESASPAGSFHARHDQDQQRLVEQAFSQVSAIAANSCPA